MHTQAWQHAQTVVMIVTHKRNNTTLILSLSEQTVTQILRLNLVFRTNWEIHSRSCSGLTHTHTDTHTHTHRKTQTHKHIWSVVPLAVQKGQFFCQGSMLLANVAERQRGAVVESSAHLALHTQSVILSVLLTQQKHEVCATVLCDGPKNTVLDNLETKK